MPMIELKIGKGGKINADYDGFPNNMCDNAEQNILEHLKRLKLESVAEERKEDELLQEESQVE